MTLDMAMASATESETQLVHHNFGAGQDLAKLDSPKEVFRFKENELIFKVNESPKNLFYVKSGCVKIITFREQARGRLGRVEHITKLVGPGEYFGFKALIKGTPYSFTAKTAKASEIYVYSGELLTSAVNSPNEIFKRVLVQALEDLEQANTTNKLHYLASVQERIAHQLLQLGDRFGVPTSEGVAISLKMTRSELAQLAGTINESLSRHLTELKNEGILELRGREIIIKNRAALAQKI